jgi:enoyl-CoA hydratase/carnithine racemase
MGAIIALPQPVIARVHGTATAAGCQLVATCDLAVASTAARFAVSGISVGLFCSTPGVALSRNVSRKRAMEMLLTGEFIDAVRAVDYGLVNLAVEPDKLDEAVYDLAGRIAARPTHVVRLGKELFYRQIEAGLDAAYDLAGEAMACNMMLEDAAEGIDAFIEKRSPNWPSPGD